MTRMAEGSPLTRDISTNYSDPGERRPNRARNAVAGFALTAAALAACTTGTQGHGQYPRQESHTTTPAHRGGGTPKPAPTNPLSHYQPQVRHYTEADQRAAFQTALAEHESGTRWRIIQSGYEHARPAERASGAYQYSTGRWQRLGGTGEAFQASPAEQYTRAKKDIETLRLKDDDWAELAVDWSKSSNPQQYADEIMVLMGGYLARPGTIPKVPGEPVAVYNPESVGK